MQPQKAANSQQTTSLAASVSAAGSAPAAGSAAEALSSNPERIVIEVMPKPEILDPQGRAVSTVLQRDKSSALAAEVAEIRVGKRFEIRLRRPVTDADLHAARELAEALLANPTIEDVVTVTPG